jgi:nucleosome assembly protein 1-like 1
MNHPGLSMIIAERDQKALEYLIDIRCTYFTGRPVAPVKPPAISYAVVAAGTSTPSNALAITSGEPSSDDIGYKLSFDFRSNPYFTDNTLEKTYYYKNGQVDEFGEFLYAKSVGCTIHWKSGMDLTAANAAGDAAGPVSFFTFFQPKSLPSESEVNKMTDEDYIALLDDIEGDFECGGDIRDEVHFVSIHYVHQLDALTTDPQRLYHLP